MFWYALLCFGGKSFKTFSLKNLHHPLDQNEGFNLKTTYIKLVAQEQSTCLSMQQNWGAFSHGTVIMLPDPPT